MRLLPLSSAPLHTVFWSTFSLPFGRLGRRLLKELRRNPVDGTGLMRKRGGFFLRASRQVGYGVPLLRKRALPEAGFEHRRPTMHLRLSPSRVLAVAAASLFLGIATSGTSSATICVVPDDGSGTASFPPDTSAPGCTTGYASVGDMAMIIDGLPPGQMIAGTAEHEGFLCDPTNSLCSFAISPLTCDQAGGGLGGEEQCFASSLHMQMQGAGGVAYTRTITLPVNFETHTGPRAPGSPVQSFDTDMFRLQGQLPPGDPDFDLLRITAGSDFGMPSPGHTTLTKASGGNWNVDSFFDIAYRIDFIGAPGGAFAGMSGSTTASIRMRVGEPAVFDHMECFKAKDALKLQGVVDLPSLAGTPYDGAGCTIGGAKKYCTPVAKVVVSSTPAATPMPGPGLTSDYVCYKLKCPAVEISQAVTDQFGARTLTKLKTAELCVPAVKGP